MGYFLSIRYKYVYKMNKKYKIKINKTTFEKEL